MSARRSLVLVVAVVVLLFAGVGLRVVLVPKGEAGVSAPARPETGPAADPASAPVVRGGKPPAELGPDDADRVRITLSPATGGEAGKGARPEGPFPYPWALPSAARATEEALEKRIDLDFTDANLFDLLEFIREFARLDIDIRDRERASKTITFQTRELSLRNTLSLLVRQYDLGYIVAEDGRIVVDRREKLEELPATKAQRGLQHARTLEAGDERTGPSAADRTVEEKLQGTAMNVNLESATLGDAVSFVRELTGVNLVIDMKGNPDVAEAKISLLAENRRARDVLAELAGQCGQDVVVENGVAVLLPKEEAGELRAKRSAHVAEVDRVLSRRVAFDGPEVAGNRLAGFLQEQTGTPVIVTEEVWNRAEPLPVPLGGRRFEEVLNYVTLQAGLKWRLVDGVVYVY